MDGDHWLNQFGSVWSLDFEFSAPPGERPTVVCLVAVEHFTKELRRYTMDELRDMPEAPFNTEEDLFVAYYSPAEWSCFLELGWELPAYILDLYVEFRNKLNDSLEARQYGLLACLKHFDIPGIESSEKTEMRGLAMRGGPYTEDEMESLLVYCESDVRALDQLIPHMTDGMSELYAARAINVRGRYTKAVARMERTGVPIDVEFLGLLLENWDRIKHDLIVEVDEDYGVYKRNKDGTLSFNQARFVQYLKYKGLKWPLLESGKPKLDRDTFKEMAKVHPELSKLRYLRQSIAEMRSLKLGVGSDGRNRAMLSPFRSMTGRNQPSNSRFIFGAASWMRGIIKPDVGRAIAYIDWSQQELGIAAAFSRDPNMLAAYESGDPYLEFAKMAEAAPPDATKASHPAERAAYKECMLGVQYGMGYKSLAIRLGSTEAKAEDLLRRHREAFPVFWEWTDGQVTKAFLDRYIETVFGWRRRIRGSDNTRSVGNYQMQAHGAEMLRIACCMVTEAGINLCAPIHDAILVEDSIERIDETVEETQRLMRKASRIVLKTFELESDSKVFKYPERFSEGDRGKEMWDTVCRLLDLSFSTNRNFVTSDGNSVTSNGKFV